ncbi:MAG: hypothetical protein JWQ81_8169 [Amycolatopsis sp.]|uniref:MFS transporter n=1 Tax=Amycolatopsis sp. TaxID=37632 RepID=UPI002619BF9A|nr:MFS transporter [Amycolatopsis sp.]MCU1687430.1 hypothetical protein [Amycolatopsis sp.]
MASVPGGTAAASALTDEPVPLRGRLLTLMISMFVANLGTFLVWGAGPLLLAVQTQNIDSAHKAGNLAAVATTGALTAMVAGPLAGRVSDRTRSRFGRRTPWMVVGGLVGGLAMIGVGSANTVVQLALAWAIVNVGYNFALGPLSAVFPDRVPPAVRGKFSAVTGLGLTLGATLGAVIGARFASATYAGYLLFGGISLVLLVLFVVFNPDTSTKGLPRAPFSPMAFLQSFWVSPRRYPDFAWGFAGRILLYLGYFLVHTYLLYILQDYIGLGDKAIQVVPLLAGIGLAGLIVGSLTAGLLSDRWGRRRVPAVVAGVIMAVALAIPFSWPTLAGMVAYAATAGVGVGAYASVDTALMSQVLPSSADFAKDLGVLNIASTLPQTLAPALAGLIVVELGGYAALFPVGIVLALAGSFAVLRIKSVR